MKILAIFAHPDDESYGPGGTLAHATGTGHIVSLLTLTHGESGSMGISKSLSAEELAKRRRNELRCAAEKLGIQHLQIHNLSDKQLQDTPDHHGITIIMQEIKRFKPDIIITFHENAISGHPDHLVVTNWTFNTIKTIPNPPKLFFYGLNQEQTSIVTFRKLIPIENEEITHIIDVENFVSDKIAAIECHKTQISLWHQFQNMKIDFGIYAKLEIFVQKWPKLENTDIKHDLFDE
jgi:LmbE family N-acetylglucosaminyl deacetylase